ncbi:glycosyltransferase [Polynucleobacter sp. UB-Siik-W21]|uniref:glycosyltransferase n=1 Tax=Polynucleobacter sp. UB-Siik-W21 TaxID=1855646 RepID=UPI001BFE3E2B|nr:glycosyltransferase [Polynucleobacter sp. UB-Siik-W21]QWD70722.1 glycosyltransferase [Polynucleobacter sp. UB-Siik-W21]
MKRIGIIAINIGGGGTLVNLQSLLNEFIRHDIPNQYFIWAESKILSKIPDGKCIVKIPVDSYKYLWLFWGINKSIDANKIDLILVPGGFFLRKKVATIVYSQNLLPFTNSVIIKYFPSLNFFRLLLLKFLYIYSFSRANSIVYLSENSKSIISKQYFIKNVNNTVIPNGVNEIFIRRNKSGKILKNGPNLVVNILYLSRIDEYKNHIPLFNAVMILRARGYIDLRFSCVGPAYKKSKTKLLRYMDNKSSDWPSWFFIKDEIPYEDVAQITSISDLGIFLSECESMPISMIEMMARGLPMVCSNVEPMRSIAGESALFVNPRDELSIANAIERLILDDNFRLKLSFNAKILGGRYKWSDHADRILDLSNQVLRLDN